MAENIISKNVLHHELPIIPTVEISHETQIKGHHVYKKIWTLELGENLEVQFEPENPVDKYAVCLKIDNGALVWHLKKGKSGCLANTIFYYLRIHPETNYTVEVTAKRFNLGDGLGFSHGRKKVCIDYERTISFSLRFCFYFSPAVQVIGGILV